MVGKLTCSVCLGGSLAFFRVCVKLCAFFFGMTALEKNSQMRNRCQLLLFGALNLMNEGCAKGSWVLSGFGNKGCPFVLSLSTSRLLTRACFLRGDRSGQTTILDGSGQVKANTEEA